MARYLTVIGMVLRFLSSFRILSRLSDRKMQGGSVIHPIELAERLLDATIKPIADWVRSIDGKV